MKHVPIDPFPFHRNGNDQQKSDLIMNVNKYPVFLRK